MPDIEEEEEEEQQQGTKSGRSAFFAGVHQADSFSGSYRGVKSAPHGGAASVKDEDTLGSGVRCWCGEMFGHDWPGKSAGRKHPREEKQMASAAAHEEDHFDITTMRAFDRRVQRMVGDLANQFGVRVRVLDGTHVILYGLDGTGTLKVSASRAAEQSLGYLEKFAHDHVAPALVDVQAEALAARFNDPNKRRRPKVSDGPIRPAKKAVAPSPDAEVKVAPAAAVVATPPEPVRREDGAPNGWEQWYGRGKDRTYDVPLNWWKRIGEDRWRCKTCGREVTTKTGLGGHQRAHSERAAAATKRVGKDTKVKTLLQRLAIECGVDLDINSQAQSRENEKLRKQLVKVTAERDDLQARYDLIREAMRA